ncbi:DMT family transporter [Candidatus Woesearchaeota archaeon]|nr:DMT family transporter [Candidatus Woesearchaeota archaeon]
MNGAFYAVISAFFVSSSFVFTKYLLGYVGPEMLMMLWFLSAAVFSALLAYIKTRQNPLANARKFWKEGLIIGFFNAVSAILWILAIKSIGPSLTSFLLRFMTLFMIILGIIYLKERLSSLEALGAVISIAGALVISFRAEESLLPGFIIAVVAALSIAIQEFIAKLYVPRIKPYTLTSVRTTYTAMLLFLYVSATGKLSPVAPNLLLLIIAGSIISAVLGYLFFFKALEQLDISKVAIIRTLDPFVVVLYVVILFNSMPTPVQIIGGTLIVAGVIISELNLSRVKGLLRILPW